MSNFSKLLASTVLKNIGEYNLQKGKFGVEIELEGANLPQGVPGWNVHKEGSLRGNAAEYVTQGAVTRQGLEGSLDILSRSFKIVGTKLNDTYRAGIHIHYNMQERTLLEILHSIVRWVIIEPLFMKHMGAQRDGNLFCLSQYDCGDGAQWFESLCRTTNIRNFMRAMVRGKYASLNTDPLNRFGTLEARCFPSIFDEKKILSWCDMMDAVLGPSDLNPIQEFDKANMDPEGYIQDIFGKIDIKLPVNSVSLINFGLEQALPMVNIYEETLT